MTGNRCPIALLVLLTAQGLGAGAVAAAPDASSARALVLADDGPVPHTPADDISRQRAEDLARAASERFSEILAQEGAQPAAPSTPPAAKAGGNDALAPVWDWLARASDRYRDAIVAKFRNPSGEITVKAPVGQVAAGTSAMGAASPPHEAEPTAPLSWGSIVERARDWLARANRSYRNEIVKKLVRPSAPEAAEGLANTPQVPTAAPPNAATPAAPAAQEAKPAAQTAEEKRKAEADAKRAAADAQAKRKAEAKRQAEEKRKAEAEAKRVAAEAEAKRVADAKRQAEEQRKAEAEAKRVAAEAEAKRAADAKRQAEEQRKAEAEAKRVAAEAEAKRVADAKRQAEEQRKAEAEAKRGAAEAEAKRAAEAKRQDEEQRKAEAEAKRVAAEAEATRAAEAKRLAEEAEAEHKAVAEAEAKRMTAMGPERPEKPASSGKTVAAGAGGEMSEARKAEAAEEPPPRVKAAVSKMRRTTRHAHRSRRKRYVVQMGAYRHAHRVHRKRVYGYRHKAHAMHGRRHRRSYVRVPACNCERVYRCRHRVRSRWVRVEQPYAVRRREVIIEEAPRYYVTGGRFSRIYRSHRGNAPRLIYRRRRLYIHSRGW